MKRSTRVLRQITRADEDDVILSGHFLGGVSSATATPACHTAFDSHFPLYIFSILQPSIRHRTIFSTFLLFHLFFLA